MDEDKKAARRKLLAEIKGPWDAERGTPASAPVLPVAPGIPPPIEVAAAPPVEAPEPPESRRSTEDLDAGWDDDDEEEEEPEPELPDEVLDPIAYAEAKRAREQRLEARRERRRARAEMKKARRRARAQDAKGKQKQKSKKPRAAAPARGDKRASSPDLVDSEAAIGSAAVVVATPALAPRAKAQRASTNTWMLAIALGVFVAAAIAAAVLVR
jgi:hypothetical protein